MKKLKKMKGEGQVVDLGSWDVIIILVGSAKKLADLSHLDHI